MWGNIIRGGGVILSTVEGYLEYRMEIYGVPWGCLQYHGGYHDTCGGSSVPHILHVQYHGKISSFIIPQSMLYEILSNLIGSLLLYYDFILH